MYIHHMYSPAKFAYKHCMAFFVALTYRIVVHVAGLVDIVELEELARQHIQ